MRRDMREVWDRHMFTRDSRIDGAPWKNRVIYQNINLYIYNLSHLFCLCHQYKRTCLYISLIVYLCVFSQGLQNIPDD